jgi:hypothetical protein
MSDLSATAGVLGGPDVVSLSDAALTARLLARLAERDALTAEIRVLAGEWDKRLVWAGDGARSGAAWLAARTELSRGCAGAELKVARRLRSMPVVAEASVSGVLGAEKVAALTRAVDRDHVGSKAVLFAGAEEQLVADAARLTVSRRPRRCVVGAIVLMTSPPARTPRITTRSGSCACRVVLTAGGTSRAAWSRSRVRC